MNDPIKSEIRHSTIRELIDKVRKLSYGKYLYGIRLEKIRQFQGAQINFDFPVSAVIGPNGGGKSTILGAAACAYLETEPRNVFRRSKVGDDTMDGWSVEYDIIDKALDPKGIIRSSLRLDSDQWKRSHEIGRHVKAFSINRTVPAIESSVFSHRKKLSAGIVTKGDHTITTKKVEGIDQVRTEAEKILGRSLQQFDLFEVTFKNTLTHHKKGRLVRSIIKTDGTIVETREKEPLDGGPHVKESQTFMFVGHNGVCSYSEFNFGSGEASVIRTVAAMESLPDNSLVIIEEIENGLHPLAVRRMVEYLIDYSSRKAGQILFSTHSDYALQPLPPEAIWASVDGVLRQGALTIESLRAISGRIDKRLAIFVEDDFAKEWVLAVAREYLGNQVEEVGVYPVKGDGNAVQIHQGHMRNPAVRFRSICFLDGDSLQHEDETSGIFRLPANTSPETCVFNSVLESLEKNTALLTVGCQRALSAQDGVAKAIRDVSRTNRDPHLLFNQVGERIGFVSESIVRGAFLSVWIQENETAAKRMAGIISRGLESPAK